MLAYLILFMYNSIGKKINRYTYLWKKIICVNKTYYDYYCHWKDSNCYYQCQTMHQFPKNKEEEKFRLIIILIEYEQIGVNLQYVQYDFLSPS